ncbi:heparinase II/III family protein, partial [Acinetobacter baumannii]
RLARAAAQVEARRNENDEGVWLELLHDGWAQRFGVTHERRIYLDRRTDELRGEDAFSPTDETVERKSLTPFAVRFHLAPEVKVSLARDKR